MRIGYLDCFAGISGDMLLGALLHAGVPLGVLQEAAEALGLGATLEVETVERSGISCTKVHVMQGERLAEGSKDDGVQPQQSTAVAGKPAATESLHPTGHPHSHGVDGHAHVRETEPAHVHGRSLTEICRLIQASALNEMVKLTAIRTFELLGHAEAKIHNIDVEAIQFHEVGAVDAIVDIVCASAGVHHLQVGAWYCSPLNVGGGMVACAHGTFPVPAPATAELLRGYPTYSAHVQKELVTPTGAALLRALDPAFGQQPPMRVEVIGYGAGSRNPKAFPNVLRLSVGEMEQPSESMNVDALPGRETVTVIEAALDDLSPQVLAWVAEKALAEGALDVMLTPVIMKKGRPGTLLTVLCEASSCAAMERLVLTETTTLGVRIRQDRRSILDRHHVAVQTAFGVIRVKVGSLDGKAVNMAPEFEDCRAAAVAQGVPLKQVQQAALRAYSQTTDEPYRRG
jgi:uncharacterized protein (TIGR00299 family) protein